MMAYLDGAIKVKAAGGIRTREEFEFLESVGVDRYGMNLQSAVEIVESYISASV